MHDQDHQLWVDVYEPLTEVREFSKQLARPIIYHTTQAELAVHKRKVGDVRRWFQEAFEGGPAGKLKKYRVSGDVIAELHLFAKYRAEDIGAHWSRRHCEDDYHTRLSEGARF